MLQVISPGIQSTLQGAPRIGFRHLGVPYSGAADPLSMALANRLVGNDAQSTSVEITFGGFEAEAREPCVVAVTGAVGEFKINDAPAATHTTHHIARGNNIAITPPKQGLRSYLSICGGFSADTFLHSTSTYLPAGFGGYEGRALKSGDQLEVSNPDDHFMEDLETPAALRPAFSNSFALRACHSSETNLLSPHSLEKLFGDGFIAGRQGTRMGLSLTGIDLELDSHGLMKSAPVYPGTIQCPASGTPIALLCDAQTTGGYPRIAHIARCDRHLLGQIRPSDRVRLLERTPEVATAEYAAKQELLQSWLRHWEL